LNIRQEQVEAELAADLSFTSFRHEALTELGDSELTDSEIRAIGRQRGSKCRYARSETPKSKIIKATKKRRASKTKERH